MDALTVDGGALAETVVFPRYFKNVPEVRQRGRVMYPLACAFWRCWPEPRRSPTSPASAKSAAPASPFAARAPAHNHLRDIFATLDAEALQGCFVAWVAAQIGVPKGVVAIDGKMVRRSEGAAKDAILMVSAFAARQRLALGQVKAANKANEIVAIPKLLDMLAIQGAVATIDATGCQRAIAQKIVDKKRPSAAPKRRWRSRPHRDPRDHRHPRRRLVTTATRLARTEKRHPGRKHPQSVPQDRARNPLLHHLAGAPRQPDRPLVHDHWSVENSLP